MAADFGPIADFNDLVARAKARGSRRCVVACAEDCASIEALHAARQTGIAQGILYGDEQRIATICESQKFSPGDFEIHNTASQAESIRQAISDVAGNGGFLMKGQIDTATFMRGVLDEGLGLRGDRILSHVALLCLATYKKVLFVTDGGINAELDLRRKIDIVRNAVELTRLLGIARPRVALLSAVEKITLGIAETLDWAIVTKMGDQGEFGEAVVEGPLALDIAFSPEAAKIKRVASEVSGNVDILVVPSLATGNILAKGLQYLGGAKGAGIIVGAKKPIVMLSRADSSETKLYSIALGNLAS
ncbi:bifunctional enoyl-CoA hydratase/phosphate acetyltransferase [candidate division WOR-3 bacterium]|uniref:Bifunctional enoyl-CoA hydratase/phosphate acetyltransferase n=1 Tax=candidate division WOR-3 bacterium TaxID=2052148 RepID=A0A938BQP4_UNCW3|nr:bifunctional enoyl-CoA hydratase/phosphate acetyltransferase [candidate division WOR-3 bacterium]